MNTVKAWYFTPENKGIKVIDVPQELELENIYSLLDCELFERQAFVDKVSGLTFSILMDEEGLLKKRTYNECASKSLGRVKLNWGNISGGSYAHLDGKYLVVCERKQDNLIDMPSFMTPKLLIERFNSSIRDIQKFYEKFNVL